MMTKYLTFEDALETYKISREALEKLIADGKVRTAELERGGLLIHRDDLAAIAANWLVDRAKFAHLEGQRINVSNASIKYKIKIGTISNWADTGQIKTLGYNGRIRWLNEADVAYLAKVIERAYSGEIPRGQGKQMVQPL